MLQGTPAPFTCEDAGRIKAPTLLATGGRTLRIFALTIDQLERCLPNRERVTLPGTSHGLPLEAPAAFNEAVLPVPRAALELSGTIACLNLFPSLQGFSRLPDLRGR